jgi:hypothetical protein
MDPLAVLTGLLALYGAGLSTYLAFRDRADKKPRLNVRLELAFFVDLVGKPAMGLALHGVNTGLRPVHLSKAGLIFSDGKHLPLTMFRTGDAVRYSPTPGTLEEAQPITAYVSLEDAIRFVRAYVDERFFEIVGYYEDAEERGFSSARQLFSVDHWQAILNDQQVNPG